MCRIEVRAFGVSDFVTSISVLEQELNVDYKNSRNISLVIVVFSGGQCTDDYANCILQIRKNEVQTLS